MTTTESVRKELKTLEDPTYREFHSSLIPGANNILGVRIPQLRIMAKGLAKKEDWRHSLKQPIHSIMKRQCYRE